MDGDGGGGGGEGEGERIPHTVLRYNFSKFRVIPRLRSHPDLLDETGCQPLPNRGIQKVFGIRWPAKC